MLVKFLIVLAVVAGGIAVFTADAMYSIYGLQCIILAKLFDMDKDLK